MRDTDGRDDIAIVGMACLYPGAPDLKTFWRNIASRVGGMFGGEKQQQ